MSSIDRRLTGVARKDLTLNVAIGAQHGRRRHPEIDLHYQLRAGRPSLVPRLREAQHERGRQWYEPFEHEGSRLGWLPGIELDEALRELSQLVERRSGRDVQLVRDGPVLISQDSGRTASQRAPASNLRPVQVRLRLLGAHRRIPSEDPLAKAKDLLVTGSVLGGQATHGLDPRWKNWVRAR